MFFNYCKKNLFKFQLKINKSKDEFVIFCHMVIKYVIVPCLDGSFQQTYKNSAMYLS